MIEIRFRMHNSVVNVNGREEQCMRIAADKRERHRVYFRRYRTCLELKHCEAVTLVRGQIVPRLVRKSKPLIQSGTIVNSRNTRCLKIPYLLNFEHRALAGRRRAKGEDMPRGC